MRIALFGTGGPLTEAPLRALAQRHEVAAFVRPLWRPAAGLSGWARRGASRLGWGGRDSLGRGARDLGAELLVARGRADADLRDRLARLDLDAVCIATFRWVLDESFLSLGRLGWVNLHASLLPRHRGANPFFWLYREDDREAGVCVHRVTAQADAGPVLAREAFELPRGRPADWTAEQCARRGGALLLGVLEGLQEGPLPGTPQDERCATRAPFTPPGFHAVDFGSWDVERVWHFLSGVFPRFREPLLDERGAALCYGGVGDYRREVHGRGYGSVWREGEGWSLACRGGIVSLRGAGASC